MRGIDRSAACRVDRAEALRYLGHVGQAISPELDARIDGAIELCERASKPAWCYRVFAAERDGEKVLLSGSAISLPASGTGEPLSRAAQCAVMACTIGLSYEREALRLAAVDATDALLYDTAGSSLVEACADACELAIREYAAGQGLHAGQRTSPGYGDVPLSASAGIVRALDAGKLLGISVTESDMLIPTKSVTAFVPLFESEDDARRARRSCAECVVKRDCAYLKAGTPCNL